MLKLNHIFAPSMLPTVDILKNILKRKLVTALLVTASVASFATLGDGGGKKNTTTYSKSLLSTKSYNYNYKTFSLKSGYNYRGSSPLSLHDENKYIMLNTVITYQKGNSTYILPMKKKVLLDKIKFNPAIR
jgi:hypothetical protein